MDVTLLCRKKDVTQGNRLSVLAAGLLNYLQDQNYKLRLLVPGHAGTLLDINSIQKHFPCIADIRRVSALDPSSPDPSRLATACDLAESAEFAPILAEPGKHFIAMGPHWAPLVHKLSASCRKTHLCVDLSEHGSRYGGDQRDAAEQQFSRSLHLELCRFFDATLWCSFRDLKAVQGRHPEMSAHFLPIPVPVFQVNNTSMKVDIKYDLLSHADDQPITLAGLEWFYRHIYQLFLRPRNLSWAITGPACRKLTFHGRKIISLEQVTPEFAEVYRASRLFILPPCQPAFETEYLPQILSYGCAVIANGPIGLPIAEELHAPFLQLEMAHDPCSAAQRILDLLAAPNERLKMQERAVQYVAHRHRQPVFCSVLDRALGNTSTPAQEAA